MQDVPPVDHEALAEFSPRFRPRPGQSRVFRRIAQTGNKSDLIVLPTGYGKSIAALGAFEIMRRRGLVKSLLWLVARDSQRAQLVVEGQGRGVLDDADLLGLPLSATDVVRVELHQNDLDSLIEDRARIFVATYQTLLHDDFGHVRRLMVDPAGGPWMVVIDEAHHLSEDGRWYARVDELPFAYRLYMTATPFRTDQAKIGDLVVKDGAYQPLVSVSVREGIRDDAIAKPIARVQHYHLTFRGPRDEVVEMTTEDLAREGVSTPAQLSEYEARKQYRYNGGFLDRILQDALARLDQKNTVNPGEHQMIVFAMTCAHARHVCQKLNAHRKGVARWVGVTERGGARPSGVNRKAIDDFKGGAFPVLVNVGIAAEGFNNPRVSVAVFLHLLSAANTVEQQIGRAMRRNPRIESRTEDEADLFAPSDSPVGRYVQDYCLPFKSVKDTQADLFDLENESASDPWPELPDFYDFFIEDAEHYRTDVLGRDADNENADDWRQKAARWLLDEYGRADPTYRKFMQQHFEEQPEPRMTRKQQAVARGKQINSFVSGKLQPKIASVLGLGQSTAAKVYRAVHGAANRHVGVARQKDMGLTELKAKWEWLRALSRDLRRAEKQGGAPAVRRYLSYQIGL